MIIISISFFIHNVKAETNCKGIKPKIATDCQLSLKDTEKYKYCCYLESLGMKLCEPYDEAGYQEELKDSQTYSFIVDAFECHTYSSSSSNTVEKTSNNCEDIFPNTESDCILSDEDVKNNYTYCCYEEISNVYRECSPETQESYEEELKAYEISKELNMDVKMKCNKKSAKLEDELETYKTKKKAESTFLGLSILSFITILL